MPLVTPLTLAPVIVIALYAIVVLISFRWFIPHLSTNSRRLALSLVALHAFVLLLALQAASTDTYVLRLFHLDRENNLATSVAGMQLALVAELALIIALLARGRSPWWRLYLLGFSLLFFYFAWDELTLQHEQMDIWEPAYAAIGVVVVVVASLLASRSPRHTWIWYICLLTGLAMSAAGALLLEQLRFNDICSSLGFVHFDTFLDRDKCLIYLIEESLELLGIWLVLVAMLGLLSDVVPKPKLLFRWLLYALPVFTFVICVAIRNPDMEYMHRKLRETQASPADVMFESGVQLYGYQIERGAEENYLQVSLWLSALPFGYNGLGYSINLLDPINAASLSSRDNFVSVSVSRMRGPWYVPVFRQAVQLETAPDFPRNHAFLVVLTVWREQGDHYARQRIVSSDHTLLSDTQVALDELVLPAAPIALPPPPPPRARFDNGFAFYAADMPERARPGATLPLVMTWQAEADGGEDYTQFLHFSHEETSEFWAFDQQPLGPRLPTRLWYSGLADSETWQIPLPADLAPGRYQVWTGLYQAKDLKRLPAVDADGTAYPDARVPLGTVTIEPA